MSDELKDKIKELSIEIYGNEFKNNTHFNKSNKEKVIELENLYRIYLYDNYPDEMNELHEWLKDKNYMGETKEYANLNTIIVKKVNIFFAIVFVFK